MNRIRNSVSGFTLIELLIAALLSSIVIGAAFKVYLVQQKHLIVQDQITDMQQAGRSSMDELASKIMMAGHNLPSGISPVIASNTNPDTIELIFDNAALENVQIEHAMPNTSAELRCDGHDLSGITDDDWLYIYDPTTKTGEYFQASKIQYSSSNIQHNTMNLSKAYPIGSKVMKIVFYKYYVNTTTDANHPQLMVSYMNQTPQAYADNISDLQFRYVLSSGTIVDAPVTATMIREVIINLTARTERADNQFAVQYRTRNLETRVKVRNLGMR